LYHPTLGLRVIKKKKKTSPESLVTFATLVKREKVLY